MLAQHVAGIHCFAASFRRPLFCIFQEVYSFITSFGLDPSERRRPPKECSDELLLAVLLMPFAFSNLRAPLHARISISDASEEGAGSAIADKFLVSGAPRSGDAVAVAKGELLSQSADARVYARAKGSGSLRSPFFLFTGGGDAPWVRGVGGGGAGVGWRSCVSFVAVVGR